MSVAHRAVYATQPRPLQKQIDDLLKGASAAEVTGEVLAVIVPDTNQLESGAAAASIYKSLEARVFDTVILVAPSHEGEFRRLTICSVDTYHTPLGELRINDKVRNELCDEDDDIFLDDRGHYHTEGVDVQLPFLQTVLNDAFDIVPVVMGEETPALCRELGHAIGEVMYNRRTLVVASADVRNGDAEGMAEFKRLFEAGNVDRLMALLNSETVQIEGKGAVLVALIAALHRRANDLRVLSAEAPSDDTPGVVCALLTRQ